MGPKRPESRPTTPSIPIVRSERESERAPSSDEREKFLRELRAVEERGKAALERSTGEMARLYERQLAERDDRIRELQNQLLAATAADGSIHAILSQLHQRDDDLARRIEEINRPRTEATALATAGQAINSERKREFWWKVAQAIAVLILALWQLLGGKLPQAEPTATVPVPTVRPASPGTQH